ncbi:MAG: 3-oxoadipate enol-lactonase [Burkholderiales bacterium]|nr:3-oxoadipate enol-lactonase [Burkholderiales bacterium]
MIQKVKANGMSVVYRFDGPQDAPVVMLSNSLMSDHTMWDPQLPVLTKSFRVLRYDTRGHGASDAPPGPYTIKLLAEDVIALLDVLKIDKVHFAGLSMGGMIGQFLGANHADRLLSLLLCDTASEMPTLEMWSDRISTAETKGVPALVDGTLKRWFSPPFLATGDPSIEKVAAMIRTTSTVGYVGCACAVRDMSQTAILSKIKVPTIIIVGEDDPACTVEQSRVLQEHIEGADMVVLKSAAHLSNIEQTEAFNAAVMTFLTAQSPRA